MAMLDDLYANLARILPPPMVDATEISVLGRMLADDTDGSEDMAVRSYQARQRGEKLEPMSPTDIPGRRGEDIRAELERVRRERKADS
jgi:hypothetical protein